MSVPGNINTAPPPSSFDDNADFYEESRFAKLKRRVIEEPLIPLGCALTCWALYEATKAIKTGDHHRTNRMFRRRIYAQGFTILAMVVGSAYWEEDRSKRKEYDTLLEDKKKKEKHEAWLKELEARDQEEDELRRIRDGIIKGRKGKRAEDGEGKAASVLEECEKGWRGEIGVLMAVRGLWESKR
ncbi:hypothetical protein K431DRAFT_341243 [Polychaeton citri CBS 116435]|uniref:HIG1 domain-containing protein n=1 Tax=Polychaeton citri CBS 116435 TaxID=1314669 RepID=A0A9P4UJ58_9PEZI|nr:hypothetical protein K431DRAFT_341243 [Polychaeton citri CBS 116435]